jgi:restriction system protein
MSGFKHVSQQHDAALSRIDSAELARLLATYYREVGWWVESAGVSAAGLDSGFDLKIRRDAEVVLVHCKLWNAEHVPHAAVHELIAEMASVGATGAILVSGGEFTRAAIDAAQGHGQVRLIDSDTLGSMLGVLPQPVLADAPAPPPPRQRMRMLLLLLTLAAIAFILFASAILDLAA